MVLEVLNVVVEEVVEVVVETEEGRRSKSIKWTCIEVNTHTSLVTLTPSLTLTSLSKHTPSTAAMRCGVRVKIRGEVEQRGSEVK